MCTFCSSPRFIELYRLNRLKCVTSVCTLMELVAHYEIKASYYRSIFKQYFRKETFSVLTERTLEYSSKRSGSKNKFELKFKKKLLNTSISTVHPVVNFFYKTSVYYNTVSFGHGIYTVCVSVLDILISWWSIFI